MQLDYDYFRITALYNDDMQSTFYMRIPCWQFSPCKDNWQVERISKEEYNSAVCESIER